MIGDQLSANSDRQNTCPRGFKHERSCRKPIAESRDSCEVNTMKTVASVVIGAALGIVTLTGAQALQRMNPPGMSQPQTYSHVVRSGNTVYIAGQVGADAKGTLAGPGMREQVERVLANLGTALASQKLDVSHVAKINIYVTSIDEFRAPEVAAIRAKFFGNHRPASTLVQVVRLADPAFKVEIEAMAVAP
jgi:enamine deaminase RidA (YjgF/YER057c/UK114 family)